MCQGSSRVHLDWPQILLGSILEDLHFHITLTILARQPRLCSTETERGKRTTLHLLFMQIAITLNPFLLHQVVLDLVIQTLLLIPLPLPLHHPPLVHIVSQHPLHLFQAIMLDRVHILHRIRLHQHHSLLFPVPQPILWEGFLLFLQPLLLLYHFLHQVYPPLVHQVAGLLLTLAL